MKPKIMMDLFVVKMLIATKDLQFLQEKTTQEVINKLRESFECPDPDEEIIEYYNKAWKISHHILPE